MSTGAVLPVVLSNLWPLAGVLFLDWNTAAVIYLYWVENIVIGVWNAVKIVGAKNTNKPIRKNVFLALFFSVHYGIFCFIHGKFIQHFINSSEADLVFLTEWGFLLGILNLLVFHGINTVRNYFLSGKYKTTHPSKQLFAPYRHIFVIHIAIIAAGAFVMKFDQTMLLLVLMIVGKTFIEIAMLGNSESSSKAKLINKKAHSN